MTLETFTLLHVLISLIGIATGLVVLAGLLNNKVLDHWTAVFLITTALTSITGYFFPFHGVTPAHIVGFISLVALGAAIAARYLYHFAGRNRWIYVAGSVLALYLNVFVLVVQSFLKIPALHALAPTQTEPAFAVAQTIVLALFLGLGIQASRRFRMVPMKSSLA